jgi:diguanylate cyclase (GGDEF) domain
MRFHKAQIYFFLLMALVVTGALSAWMAWASASGLAASDVAAFPTQQYAFLSMVMTGLGVVCGALLIYPTIARAAAEQGKLRMMTESLSVRSQTLEHAAVTDGLTGMHNRRYFDDALREYLAAFKRIGKPIGMIVLDLDHFKQVNDTHGHDAGDEVLRQVAVCLQEFTRYHDVVARLGGEEFAILSPNVGLRQLVDLAERIRKAVGQLAIPISGNVTIRVTISAGVAIWDGKETGESLYRRADKQLYDAKRAGRNRVSAA